MKSPSVIFFLGFVLSVCLPNVATGWELSRGLDRFTDQQIFSLIQESAKGNGLNDGHFVLRCKTDIDGKKNAEAFFTLENRTRHSLMTDAFDIVSFRMRIGQSIISSVGDTSLNKDGIFLKGDALIAAWSNVLRGDGRIRIEVIAQSRGYRDERQVYDFNGRVMSGDAVALERECPILEERDRAVAADKARKEAKAITEKAAKMKAENEELMRHTTLSRPIPEQLILDIRKNYGEAVSKYDSKYRRAIESQYCGTGPYRISFRFKLGADGKPYDVTEWDDKQYRIADRQHLLVEHFSSFRLTPAPPRDWIDEWLILGIFFLCPTSPYWSEARSPIKLWAIRPYSELEPGPDQVKNYSWVWEKYGTRFYE